MAKKPWIERYGDAYSKGLDEIDENFRNPKGDVSPEAAAVADLNRKHGTSLVVSQVKQKKVTQQKSSEHTWKRSDTAGVLGVLAAGLIVAAVYGHSDGLTLDSLFPTDTSQHSVSKKQLAVKLPKENKRASGAITQAEMDTKVDEECFGTREVELGKIGDVKTSNPEALTVKKDMELLRVYGGSLGDDLKVKVPSGITVDEVIVCGGAARLFVEGTVSQAVVSGGSAYMYIGKNARVDQAMVDGDSLAEIEMSKGADVGAARLGGDDCLTSGAAEGNEDIINNC